MQVFWWQVSPINCMLLFQKPFHIESSRLGVLQLTRHHESCLTQADLFRLTKNLSLSFFFLFLPFRFFHSFLAIRIICFWNSLLFVALVGMNGLLGPMTLHFPYTLETFLAFFISSGPLVLKLQSPVRKSVWCCLMGCWAPPTKVFFPFLWFSLDSFKHLGFQVQWPFLLCVLLRIFSSSFMLEDWYLLLKIISVDIWCLVYLIDSSEFNEN